MILKKARISLFLAIRQIKKANLWVNLLIVFIMTVTFLNLVFISGLLNGLVTGSSNDIKGHYSREIIITPKEDRERIKDSFLLLSQIEEIPEIEGYSLRYLDIARIEKETSRFSSPNEKENAINAIISGINFEKENFLTDLESFIIEGEYIKDNFHNQIIIGSGLLSQYDSAIGEERLEDVFVGSKIRINFQGNSREYSISGILRSKIGQINSRIFIDERQFLNLTGRSRHLSDEIIIGVEDRRTKETIRKIETSVFDAKAETWQENQGSFFEDLSRTFSILGTVIGAIGIMVASITLFIVIFINAISREKYIGILKAIGIEDNIIKYSYLFQSFFYSLLGSLIGLFILYIILVPYFNENPIDFPFSDGILDVTAQGTIVRIIILFISSMLAGYIPSKIILRKNIIDSILGR